MTKKKAASSDRTVLYDIVPLTPGNIVRVAVTPYPYFRKPSLSLHLMVDGATNGEDVRHGISTSVNLNLAPLQVVRLIDILQSALGELPESNETKVR